jgi:hypothetical protein
MSLAKYGKVAIIWKPDIAGPGFSSVRVSIANCMEYSYGGTIRFPPGIAFSYQTTLSMSKTDISSPLS